jgi:hypothetical protein
VTDSNDVCKGDYPIDRETERCKKNNRLTCVLGAIIGFFVVSNLLHIYRAWLKYVLATPVNNTTLAYISFSLMHANSAINVFFYGLFKKDFRREMAKLFGKRVTRGRVSARYHVTADKRTTEL